VTATAPLVPTGHLNVFVKDHDSYVTGNGKHDRVVVFEPDRHGMYVRVDHNWNLGMPTNKQILDIARKKEGIRGRWKLSTSNQFRYEGVLSTHLYFVPAGGKP